MEKLFMIAIFRNWAEGWRNLDFKEKHSVVFSLAGVVATVVFGISAAILGRTQLLIANRAAEEQRAKEIIERNQQELKQAHEWFAGPHSDGHDDILSSLEEHILKHIEKGLTHADN